VSESEEPHPKSTKSFSESEKLLSGPDEALSESESSFCGLGEPFSESAITFSRPGNSFYESGKSFCGCGNPFRKRKIAIFGLISIENTLTGHFLDDALMAQTSAKMCGRQR